MPFSVPSCDEHQGAFAYSLLRRIYIPAGALNASAEILKRRVFGRTLQDNYMLGCCYRVNT